MATAATKETFERLKAALKDLFYLEKPFNLPLSRLLRRGWGRPRPIKETMAAKLLLSDKGLRVLGSTMFRAGARRGRGVSGSVLGYQTEGVWFSEPSRARTVGFQTRTPE